MDMEAEFLKYVEMVNNLNNFFEGVKYDAFMRYANFDVMLNKTKNYQLKLNTRSLKIGKDVYRILPVGTMAELDAHPGFIAYDGSHPSNYFYQELADAVDEFNLPSMWASPPSLDDGATEGFKFGYMLSSVLCDKLGGKTFASVCPKKGTWLWFIVMEGVSKSAKNLLEFVNMSVDGFINPDNGQTAIQWYDSIKMIPLIATRMTY